MGKIMEWWKNHRPTTRRLAQVYAALLYNANLKGFIEGEIYDGAAKAVCVPGFNCYSCPGAIGACPLGSLQAALNASGHRAPWYMMGILMLFGIMLGRTICGWFCPLGLIQELLHKIPTPKIRKSRFTRALSYLKYIILAVFVIAIPVWYGVKHDLAMPGFCKYICPAGTFEGAVGLLANEANKDLFGQLGMLFTRKFVIMTVIGLACIFCYRSFCRFVCPLGAIYGLFNKFAVVGVKVDTARCNGCGACVCNCGMDIRHVSDHECISCGKCISSCAQGAISMKCGKLTLKGPETGKNADPKPVVAKRKLIGRILWTLAILGLAVVLAWFNVIKPRRLAEAEAALEKAATSVSEEKPAVEEPAPEETPKAAESVAAAAEPATVEEDYSSEAEVGFEVGNQLADFETPLIGGGEFHLAEHRGKVVFINLWATFCKPCVGELPFFEQLKVNHPEIEILAIHNGAFTKEPEVVEYLQGRGWDHLKFALDNLDQTLFKVVNGSTKMPQTVVLNKKGEVIFNERRSMTYEMLEQLLQKAEQSE